MTFQINGTISFSNDFVKTFFVAPTPTLMASTWFNDAHGPSQQHAGLQHVVLDKLFSSIDRRLVPSVL